MENIVFGIIIFVFGIIIGSFLNVCIYRLPREESVVNPPSHCTSCGNRLGVLDLVPVFSYLFLRGKCRHCGAKISPRYPLIEALTGAIFVILFLRFGLSIELAASIFLMAILIPVFFIDLEHQIVPDELVIVGMVGAVIFTGYNFFNPVELFGESVWWNRLLGLIPGTGFLLFVAIIGYVIYKTDAMGMGDVKLFAPIGIFLGWKLCLLTLLLSVFVAGVISIFLMILGKKSRKDAIPFGPFIVIGTFISLMWGTQLLQWYINRVTVGL